MRGDVMETGIIDLILNAVKAELFFALCLLIVFAGFTTCLFISVFKKGYGKAKRLWYFIIVAICYALLKSRTAILGEADYSPLLSVWGLILFLPLYFIPVKSSTSVKDDASRRELVRFIDGKIKGAENNYSFDTSPLKAETETVKATSVAEEKACDLDFSHVKNVLQRLEPASLSTADRRQIHDLELALYQAERGDCHAEIKGKINEGLGNLLKIMAKHGV